MHLQPEPADTAVDRSRRQLLTRGLSLGGVVALASACAPAALRDPQQYPSNIARGASAFGFRRSSQGMPEFVYTADQQALPAALWDPIDRPPSRRHFHMLGNRAIQVQASNTGDIALFDESEGMRWLVYGDDSGGTGHSLITEQGGGQWGSSFARRPAGQVPERTFGPTCFTIGARANGLQLVRTILCPEAEVPWLLIRVQLSLATDAAPRRITHREQWQLRPRFLHTWQGEQSRQQAAATVSYQIVTQPAAVHALELFPEPGVGLGKPIELVLQALGSSTGDTVIGAQTPAGALHPLLHASTDMLLQPGETRSLWFRFGRASGAVPANPLRFYEQNQAALTRRLPQARAVAVPAARWEIPWHSAALSGGANRDAVLGGHTLNQGSIYGFGLGANAAARDALQHALPLVYSEPDLALSVLRNTCAWGSPDGDLPYALDGGKQPITTLFRPSDQNLWALWLAAEYAAVTGDLAAFAADQPYHPLYNAAAVSLKTHLLRQFRFLVDVVGRGERNHLRILNADWNDMALDAVGVSRALMMESGSSVLNSAMASWVFSVFAPLMARLGEVAVAAEAGQLALELRQLVKNSWNGRWFDRAYAPGGHTIGADRCWLEVQPWAILCGAASTQQARDVLSYIDHHHRRNSPLGARIIWPPDTASTRPGQGVEGGIWYSINATLVWAAATVNPALAWDEWQRMSLANHSAAYPGVWEGTLSGADAWNAPESDRPGRTWSTPRFSMQAFPVSNLHAHSQPLLAYLRLLGVAPDVHGGLSIRPTAPGYGGEYHSSTFSIDQHGHGWLRALGRVSLATGGGLVAGAAGKVFF